MLIAPAACAGVLTELLRVCEHREPRQKVDTVSVGACAAVAHETMTEPSSGLRTGQSTQELQQHRVTKLGTSNLSPDEI